MQAQFDKLVSDFSQDAALEEAIQEAIECLRESGCNLDGVFLYENPLELSEKNKMEGRCLVIEKASRQQDTFVNALFAIQGMKQILCGNPVDKVTIGSWKLVESRKLFHSVLDLLPPVESDEMDEARGDQMGEDSDGDEEDEEEERAAVIAQALQFACVLIRSGMSINHRIRDPQNTFAIDTARFQFLCAKFDEIMSYPKYVFYLIMSPHFYCLVVSLCSALYKCDSAVVAFLDFFNVILARPENRELFSAAGGVALLDLASKMNKSHTVVPAQVAFLLAEYF